MLYPLIGLDDERLTVVMPSLQPYDELAAADKRRYQEEKEDYVPDPSLETTRSTRKKKDPLAPKRALSAYFFFCNEIRPAVRAENPNKRITEIATLLAEKWRALPDKKRTKYHKMHEDDKVRYQREMDAYNHGKLAQQEEDEEVGEEEEGSEEEDEDEDDE